MPSYEPQFPPANYKDDEQLRERQAVAQVMHAPQLLQFDVLHIPPTRPQEGMVAFADGTDWNPAGAGGGLHQYFGGAWVKL